MGPSSEKCRTDDTAAVRLLLLDLTTQFSNRRTSMWTASNRDTSELNPENRDLFRKTYVSILTTVDWKGLGVGNFTQISMSSSVGKSGRMWALLLLTLSLVSCAGAGQSVISPKLKRLREASEPYSWAHLARGTNKQPGVVDVGRMPGTNWCGKGWRADSPVDMGGYTGADRCCRHHGLGCPISIEPSETKWGLTNVRPHTVMHCSCDERFRNCLLGTGGAGALLRRRNLLQSGKSPCLIGTGVYEAHYDAKVCDRVQSIASVDYTKHNILIKII